MLYGIVLAVTFGINVPLNYELDEAVDPDRITDLADVRNQFEGPWVVANVVRTLFCTAAVAALARALFLHGRNTADRKAGASAGGSSWAPPATTFPAASSPSADPARARSVR